MRATPRWWHDVDGRTERLSPGGHAHRLSEVGRWELRSWTQSCGRWSRGAPASFRGTIAAAPSGAALHELAPDSRTTYAAVTDRREVFMQAVLMAGGKGTRLSAITRVLPKPLVPIGDISILEMVLRQLSHFGFDDVVICVGYQAQLIMALVGDGHRFGLKVRYHVEDEPLGTVGALPTVEGLDEHFLVMNGDICTNLDFHAFFDFHVGDNRTATIASYRREEKIELGVLELEEQRMSVTGFTEKPTYGFWVSMGVNAFHRDVVDLIPHNEYFGFDSLVQKMLAQRIEIAAYPFEGLWLDIGRPDDYLLMQEQFNELRSEYLPDEH
jgi:NDP-sugar pyrophosphorylase family protein